MANNNKILLDVDPTILERNLLLEGTKNDELDSLIATLKETGTPDQTPWKLVKPNAGFVVKTRTENGEKIFLNICHTDEVPAPRDITEAELIQISESDTPSSFRMPISIGDLHEEPDKSGKPCSVYDIAINTDFFRKVETNQLFCTFLLTVALEGVADKYQKQIDMNDYVILKHRKVMGTLQYHRIQRRKPAGGDRSLIEEIQVGVGEKGTAKPRFRIIRDPPQGQPSLLTVQVHVKNESSGKGLLLDIGEDRLLLRSAKKTGSLLDIFLPYNIDQDNSCAHFDTDTQILSVELPVINAGN